MINNKRVVAIIPARGGSKGVKRKNIRLIKGIPLIAWTIRAAKESRYIDRIILSSDDNEIISCAKNEGCDVPFIRPDYLAGDEASTIDVVKHALKTIESEYEIVILLQPTSPLRDSADIDGCIEMLINTSAGSVVTVNRVEKSPYWMYEYKQGGPLIKAAFETGSIISRRQDSPDFLSLNGAVYVIYSKQLKESNSFILNETAAYEMSKRSSIDIDTEDDLKYLNYLLRENHD